MAQLLKDQDETLQNAMVTTGTEIAGYRVVRNLGLVRGLTVRTRNICSFLYGMLCACVGGRNTIFLHLCEEARSEAITIMGQNAMHLGANAVIGFRYSASDIMDGMTEMIAYGTAVVVEPIEQPVK